MKHESIIYLGMKHSKQWIKSLFFTKMSLSVILYAMVTREDVESGGMVARGDLLLLKVEGEG